MDMVGKTQGDEATGAMPGAQRYLMPIRWGDLDPLNHVNNTVYFRFFEEARVQFLHGALPVAQAGKAFVLAHTACDFIRPIRYPATAVVLQKLTRIGRSSLTFEATIECDEAPGVTHAKGVYVVVAVDETTQRPVPWSEPELALLASLQQGDAGPA